MVRNTVLREMRAANLIPICAGVGGGPVEPGLDRSLCPVVMNNWDDTDRKDCTLDAIAATFPDALVFFELPEGADYPTPSGGDEPVIPRADNGGEWLRAVLRRVPNFVGVLHELAADSETESWRHLTAAHPFWRDVQEVNFESDTYWKFWDNRPEDAQRGWNDDIMRRFPWLHGCLSGCSTHPAPVTTSSDGQVLGTLRAEDVRVVNEPDFRSWPETTRLTSLRLGLDDVHVVFDKQGTWPDVSFGVQYSIGLCLKRGAEASVVLLGAD
jgi:hypothetical protein